MLLPGTRRRYSGLAISLLFHAVLLAVIVFQGERLWRRTLAPGAPSLFSLSGAGGGGGTRLTYISLPPMPKLAPQPAVTPAVPPPVEDPPVTPPETPAVALPQAVDTLPATPAEGVVQPGTAGPGAGGGTGGGTGGGVGPGTGTGTGEGDVPGSGGGGTLRPPELRDLAFPFDTPPKELRGASLNVTFWVRVDGRVDRYEVRPEIADRDYARKFDEVIRAFRFTPARAPDGSRIAGTTTVTFTLPGKRSS